MDRAFGAREDCGQNDETTATENGESYWRLVAISKQSRTSNAQRRTSNTEFRVERWTLSVQRWNVLFHRSEFLHPPAYERAGN